MLLPQTVRSWVVSSRRACKYFVFPISRPEGYYTPSVHISIHSFSFHCHLSFLLSICLHFFGLFSFYVFCTFFFYLIPSLCSLPLLSLLLLSMFLVFPPRFECCCLSNFSPFHVFTIYSVCFCFSCFSVFVFCLWICFHFPFHFLSFCLWPCRFKKINAGTAISPFCLFLTGREK